MKQLKYLTLTFVLVASISAAQSASERRFIREGMTEGRILAKVGKPDSESMVSGPAATVVVKKWIYLPTSDDANTTTTLTLRNGEVIEVKREVSR